MVLKNVILRNYLRDSFNYVTYVQTKYMMIHIDDDLESDCYVVKYSISNTASAFKI